MTADFSLRDLRPLSDQIFWRLYAKMQIELSRRAHLVNAGFGEAPEAPAAEEVKAPCSCEAYDKQEGRCEAADVIRDLPAGSIRKLLSS